MNGYRKKYFGNYPERCDSNHMGSGSFQNAGSVCTNAKLFNKLEEVEELLKEFLYVSRIDTEREYSFSRRCGDKGPCKVVQIGATKSQVDWARQDKIRDKYWVDPLHEEKCRADGGNTGDGPSNNTEGDK